MPAPSSSLRCTSRALIASLEAHSEVSSSPRSTQLIATCFASSCSPAVKMACSALYWRSRSDGGAWSSSCSRSRLAVLLPAPRCACSACSIRLRHARKCPTCSLPVGRSAGHAVICHASVASSHTALHSSLSERTGCEGLMWAEGGGAEERGCCCVSGRRLEGSGTSRCGDCFRGLSLRAASWMPRGVGASGGSTAAICDSNRLGVS